MDSDVADPVPGVDQVICADWVLTMERDPVVEAGAVAVAGDRITEVGPAAKVIAAHPDAAVVRLAGHALIPGLVNAHTHLAMTMFRGFVDDMALDAFLARLLPVESALLTAERVRLATRAAAVESVLAGTTTALDMYFFADSAAAAAREVGLRLSTGPVFFDADGPGGMGRERVLEWAQRVARGAPARARGAARHRPPLHVHRLARAPRRPRGAGSFPRRRPEHPCRRDRGRGGDGAVDPGRPTGRAPRVARPSRAANRAGPRRPSR